MMKNNSKGKASCSVENSKDDLNVLAGMKEELSKINTAVSGKLADSTNAFILREYNLFEGLRLGLDGATSEKQLKMQCVALLVKESGKDLEEYWNRIRPLEREVRKYKYSNHFSYSRGEFIKTMIRDCCFILEFFRFHLLVSQHKAIIKDHPISQIERRNISIIFKNLFAHYNQIPYPILEGLFEICYPLFQREGDALGVGLLNIIGAVSLDALGVGSNYLRRFLLYSECFERDFRFGSVKPVHLLDLVRLCFTSPNLLVRDGPEDLPQWNITLHGDNIPSISKLRLAGINVSQQNQDHYLDVTFQAGAIKMPRIILNELMCSFLANCVAFEQQYKIACKHISSYVLLLDCLVDTVDDIGHLRQRRVLEHHKKTDSELANFINNLGTRINFDGIDVNFFILCKDVNKYYLSEPRRKWVSFKYEYFDKPCLLISILAGLVLLILTCLQTYYTMYPQNNLFPPSLSTVC